MFVFELGMLVRLRRVIVMDYGISVDVEVFYSNYLLRNYSFSIDIWVLDWRESV